MQSDLYEVKPKKIIVVKRDIIRECKLLSGRCGEIFGNKANPVKMGHRS